MSEKFTHGYTKEGGGVAVEEQGELDLRDETDDENSTEDSEVELKLDSDAREKAEEEFVRNREQAFAHALEFDKSIAELRHEIALSEGERNNGSDYEDMYQTQLHFLEQQVEKQQAVAKFERKLWGASPEDHVAGKQRLLEDIALIESPQDVLALFDRWGALPGASTVDRPSINREAIASFLEKIQQRSDVPNLEERAEKLFPNKRLRQKVLQFVKQEDPDIIARISEPEVPYRDSAPEVWTEEEPLPSEGYELANQSDSIEEEPQLAKEPPSRFAGEVVDTEQEIQELRGRERALIEAQGIIDSPVFKYAPFLMRFTKKGREDLARVKSAGFTLNTRGASAETLEMARALKLKSIRERLTKLTGGAQAFAHDLVSRSASVKEVAERDYRLTTEISRERAEDSEMLRTGNTQRENLKRIKNRLVPEKEHGRRGKIHYEADDDMTISPDHSMTADRFSAPIARRRGSMKVTSATSRVNEGVLPASGEEKGVVREHTESREEKVTRKALEVFNRKKAQKEALAKQVAEVTGKTDLSQKEVRGEAVKMKRKKKAEGKTNN